MARKNVYLSMADLERAMRGKWRQMLMSLGFDSGSLSGVESKCPFCGAEGAFLFLDGGGSGFGGCARCRVKGDGFDLVGAKAGGKVAAASLIAEKLGLRWGVPYDDRSEKAGLPIVAAVPSLDGLRKDLLSYGRPLRQGEGKKVGKCRASAKCIWGQRCVEKWVRRNGVPAWEWFLVGRGGIVAEPAPGEFIAVVTEKERANEIIEKYSPGLAPLSEGECLAFVVHKGSGATPGRKELMQMLGLYQDIYHAAVRGTAILRASLVIRPLHASAEIEWKLKEATRGKEA